ncbi:MAG: efflux RND transporter periplasmic adaptor subunit, partial [Deltaproteobacteria bacterium]
VVAALIAIFLAGLVVLRFELFSVHLPGDLSEHYVRGKIDEGHGHSQEEHDTHDEEAAHDEDHAYDENHEHEAGNVVRLGEKEREALGLELATAGPGRLQIQVTLPGEIKLNEDRHAHIVPRAPGIAREVYKCLGDTVQAGEIMAILESVDIGAAKLDYLSKRQQLDLAKTDLTRMKAVHRNTIGMLDILKASPRLEELRRTKYTEMGENLNRLITAYAELVFAKAAYLREKPLYEKKISSQEEYLTAESEYKKAEARYVTTRDSIAFIVRRSLLEARRARRVAEFDLKAARRRLRILGLTDADIKLLAQNRDDEEKLSWYALRAPFSGMVIEKHISIGEKLADDAAAFTIADLSSVWVDLRVYQKDLPYVKKGQKVFISAGSGVPDATGTITCMIPMIGEKTRTALVRLVLPNPEGHLRPGLFVTAKVSTEGIDVPVLIPKTATQILEEKTVVFVQTDEGLEARAVSLGGSSQTHVEVLAGLSPGQRYVAKGAFELKAKMVTSGLGAHAGHGH